VEYSSTIMQHFSRKKERREKFSGADLNQEVHDTLSSAVNRVYLNLHQIKQDVKIPKPRQANAESEFNSKIRKGQSDEPGKTNKTVRPSIIFKPQTGSRAEHTSKVEQPMDCERHIEVIPEITLTLVKSCSEQPANKPPQNVQQCLNLVRVVKEIEADLSEARGDGRYHLSAFAE
jgi:hypothetical protein